MTRLFHVSDIHFGAEDRAALDWFAAAVAHEVPDAVIVTGDLTMRARRREFAAAAEWLAALGRPVTVEVGNHDLPYFNPLARLFNPYGRYRAVEAMIERPLSLAGVSIVPLRTTARAQWRLNWAQGRVGQRALTETLALLDTVPDDHVVLVACHHPLIDAETRTRARTHGGRAALETLTRRGADAVLTGHVHYPFDIAHRIDDATVRLIGAGTLSERLRDAPPSFNELVIADGAITTRHRMMD
ncbi:MULTISPECIES: metallophosphoesterase family protein [unclassified Sphingomonas]|uniref:metallophosphoesterase family protein n=1 Tax=unclassified Sphingomonas TaxID=196159 RepID=UPI000834A4DF|nr:MULTISPECIES: metallophosphoesterase [unclassified Sphingomonas]